MLCACEHYIQHLFVAFRYLKWLGCAVSEFVNSAYCWLLVVVANHNNQYSTYSIIQNILSSYKRPATTTLRCRANAPACHLCAPG